MEWMEVIRVRTTDSDALHLADMLQEATGDLNGIKGLTATSLYTNADLPTDLSFCLHWDTSEPSLRGSEVSEGLAKGLRHFGIVDHSVWLKK